MVPRKQHLVNASDAPLRSRSAAPRRLTDFSVALHVFVNCIAGLAVLAVVLPGMLPATLSWLLVCGALLAAARMLVRNQRAGIALWRTLVILVLAGALAYALVWGVYWFFMLHIAGPPMP